MTNYISEKINDWNKTAAIVIANHGSNNGEFQQEIWVNGKIMVSPKNTTSNPFNCVSAEQFNQIKNNGWKIYAD